MQKQEPSGTPPQTDNTIDIENASAEELRALVRRLQAQNAALEERLTLAADRESTHRQAELMELLSDAVISTDTGYRIQTWNKGAQLMYGWPEEEVLGRVLMDVVPSAPLNRTWPEIEEELWEAGTVAVEAVQLDRDGSPVAVAMTYSLIMDDENRPRGVLCVCRDITAEKKMSAALRQSEEQFRTLAESLPAMIFIATVDLRQKPFTPKLLYVNHAAEEITGYTISELLTVNPADVITEPYFTLLSRLVGDPTAEIAEFSRGECPIRTKEGELRWLESRVMPIFFSQTPAWLGVSFDITTRRQHDARLLEEQQVDIKLRETSTALNSALDYEELLDTVLPAAHYIVPYDFASIALWEDDSLVFVRTEGFDLQRIPPEDRAFTLADAPMLAPILLRNEVLIIDDLTTYHGQWPALGPLVEALGVRSFMGLPLIVKGDVMGVVGLGCSKVGHFHIRMQRGLESFLQQVALAIVNADRYRQIQAVARLRERNRIARELHDAVSQTLMSANMVANILPQAWAISPEMGQDRLQELRGMIEAALVEMRTLLVELRPKHLTAMPFPQLAEQLIRVFEYRSNIAVDVDISPELRLPPGLQVAFYRVMQEALNNAAHHAQVDGITVRVGYREDGILEMTIRDEGVGFDPAYTEPAHMGIQGMRERAAEVGAQLIIDTKPGDGTAVILRWGGATPVAIESTPEETHVKNPHSRSNR